MIGEVIFFILTLIVFIIVFLKFLRRRDYVYIYIMLSDFIGALAKIVILQDDGNNRALVGYILYAICIVIPIIIIIYEYKKMHFSELICIMLSYLDFKSNKNEKARRRLVKYITRFPNSYYAHRLLAKIYESEGKDEEAIDEYVRAIEINSKDYDSYFQISFLLNKNGKLNEAEQMLRDLIEKKPEYYKASILLGEILYKQEEFRQAISVYIEALKYNPEIYELYYGLGMSYTRLNDFQTAMQYYKKAAMINSILFHAKLNIAQIHLITGELEKAEEKFIECLQNKDTEADAYYYLSIILLLKGERDKAIAYINIAIEIDPQIYIRAYNQELFAPIRHEIRQAKNKKAKYSITYQEALTKKYLEDTFYLIERMKANNNLEKNSKQDLKKEIDKFREY